MEANWTTDFYYDGWRVLEERDGFDAVTQQYVYGGTALDEVWTLDNRQGGITIAQLNDNLGGDRQFYHADPLGSVYALTDETGLLQVGFQYDPFGRPMAFGGGGSPVDFGQNGTFAILQAAGSNPYLFTGQRFDPETGLYYYKERYYLADEGRFLSRDPIGFAAGDANLYRYMGNNPGNGVDAWGLVGGAEHHAYPLHLGGSPKQPLLDLGSQSRHQKVHNYFSKHGYGFGKAGRIAWRELSKAQQKAFIKASLRHVGVSEKIIASHIGDIMTGARPGYNRSSLRGKHRPMYKVKAFSGRRGSVSAKFILALGATVIEGGVEYAYGEYVAVGQTKGFDLATKIGIADAVRWAGTEGLLPSSNFAIKTPNGQKINIQIWPTRIVPGSPPKWYVTAWYNKEHSWYGIVPIRYTEAVELITKDDNIIFIDSDPGRHHGSVAVFPKYSGFGAMSLSKSDRVVLR
ncbi:MAG: hypothetical protein KatS3mg105_3228 [Gemmatales bacterium]|nr:MAG: hypothetical protein KatS3mg105_3228 [Gemmatales bacterium]